MIRDYKLAAATYDLVRKDFSNDKAWRDFAQASVCSTHELVGPALIAPTSANDRLVFVAHARNLLPSNGH